MVDAFIFLSGKPISLNDCSAAREDENCQKKLPERASRKPQIPAILPLFARQISPPPGDAKSIYPVKSMA
jgi:hypothetical protein